MADGQSNTQEGQEAPGVVLHPTRPPSPSFLRSFRQFLLLLQEHKHSPGKSNGKCDVNFKFTYILYAFVDMCVCEKSEILSCQALSSDFVAGVKDDL